MFMIDQLLALETSQHTVMPIKASGDASIKIPSDISRQPEAAIEHFAAARGAAMSGDWISAIHQLAKVRGTSLSHDDALYAAATARLFVLDAMPKGTIPSAMLRVRAVLDAHHPYPSAARARELNLSLQAKRRLNTVSMREKETIVASCAHSSLRSTTDWQDALSVLAEPLRYPDAPPSCATVGSSTPQTVSFVLWVPGLPWTTALSLFQQSRAELLVAEATAVAVSSTPTTISTTINTNEKLTKGHEGPYTSAMMHLAEVLAHHMDSTTRSPPAFVAQSALPLHRAEQVLENLLRELLQKCQVSPSAALLASRTSSRMLLDRQDLLPSHGSLVSAKVLFYALTTSSPQQHRINDWATGMKLVAHWARQTARKVPEGSGESVWAQMPCFPILAILDRLEHFPAQGGRLQHAATGESCVPPSSGWELALGIWKWTRNCQPGAIQKANYDTAEHKGRAAEQMALIALRSASVLLKAADRTASPQPANAACRLLFDILHRHKLRAPVHCFSPATLDLFVPTTLFAQSDASRHSGSSHQRNGSLFLLQRVACLRTCLEAVLRRVEELALQGASETMAFKNCQEGLFQCVKMASRAARLVHEHQQRRRREEIERLDGNGGPDSTVGTHHPAALKSDSSSSRLVPAPAVTTSPIPAGGTQSLPDFARSVWVVALAAAATALQIAADRTPQKPHLSGADTFRPQLLEHLLGTAAPSSHAATTAIRNGVHQAVRSGMPVSSKSAKLIVQHGYWSTCLGLIAAQHREVVLSSLTKVNPDIAMRLLDSCEIEIDERAR
jgi:hypothetical protein